MSLNFVNTFAALVKEFYQDDTISNTINNTTPLLNMVPKDKSFVGDPYVVPVRLANTQNIGVSDALVFGNTGSSTQQRATVQATTQYGLVTITRQTMKVSENNVGAFAQAVKFEIESMVREFARNLNRQLYGDGSGDLSPTAFTAINTAGNNFTVVPASLFNFEVGMLVQFVDNANALTSATVFGITAIDLTTGVVTVTGAVPALSVNAVRPGAANAEMTGLAAITDNTVTPLYGISGTTYNRWNAISFGTSGTLSSDIDSAMAQIGKNGGKADLIMCSFDTWTKIVAELQLQKRYNEPPLKGGDATVNFRGVYFVGPYGDAMVYPDQHCPDSAIYVLDTKGLVLVSRGGSEWFREDGTILLRDANADSYSARYGSYCNLMCTARNAQAKIVGPF